MKRWLGVLLLCIEIVSRVSAQSLDDYPCPAGFEGYMTPRLQVGQAARVLTTPLNFRPTPSTSQARITQLTPAATVQILGGPACNEGYVWWEAAYGDQVGWIAEANPADNEYYTEPRGELTAVVGPDNLTRFYVRRADGALEPEGCLRPPDDYTRTQLGYAALNERTLFMLDNASRIYRGWGGLYEFRDLITQGSYNPGGVDASFGTHDAGGAVDLSVRSPLDWSVMWAEIPLMIESLRIAGFAAWVRDDGELYANSPIHIHAIAVGDAELSEIARAQIDGERGYLRGYNGLPEDYGLPRLDQWGVPVVCEWMIADGFPDYRTTDYYLEIGLQYVRALDDAGAIEQFSRGIALDAGDAQLYLARGTAYDRLGRLDDALADYRQYISLLNGGVDPVIQTRIEEIENGST